MEEKILIDKKTLKALAVDTRMNILKLLTEKKYTLSDIAESLGLSNSTVKEHVDILLKAELIKREKTDRKWKYYSLTFKGKRLIQPREVKVLFAFIVTLIAAVGTALATIKNLIPAPQFTGARMMAAAPVMDEAIMQEAEVMSAPIMEAAPEMAKAVAQDGGAEALMDTAPEAVRTVMSQETMTLIIITVILIAISAFLLGYYLKKRNVIVSKK